MKCCPFYMYTGCFAMYRIFPKILVYWRWLDCDWTYRVPQVSEDVAREALLKFVGKKWKYSRKPAQHLVFKDLKPFTVYRVNPSSPCFVMVEVLWFYNDFIMPCCLALLQYFLHFTSCFSIAWKPLLSPDRVLGSVRRIQVTFSTLIKFTFTYSVSTDVEITYI